MSAHLSEEARLRLVHQLVAALGTLFAVLDTDREEEHERLEQIWRLAQRAENLLGSLQSERPGRGNCPDDRLPTLSKPKSDMYSINVKLPEVFQSLVRYTPAEFEDLHNDVLDVLMLARNHAHTFTDEENKLRRKTRFRYSSRERLFHFLYWLKHYDCISASSTFTALCRSAIYVYYLWLREQLSTHPVVVAEVNWGTPEKLELQRVELVAAGLLEPPFDNCVFMCDGSKDLGRRNARWNRQHEPDYSQKGNGKTTLMVIACERVCAAHLMPTLPCLCVVHGPSRPTDARSDWDPRQRERLGRLPTD